MKFLLIFYRLPLFIAIENFSNDVVKFLLSRENEILRNNINPNAKSILYYIDKCNFISLFE